MCIVETKTYLLPDGRREIIDTIRRCRHALGSTLCAHVERRSFEQALSAEKKSVTVRTPTHGTIVIEGTGGRQRVYRDVTDRLSQPSSSRQSKRTSDRLSAEWSGSPSSMPYVSVRPPAPTSPVTGFPFTAGGSPARTIAADGTAIYDHSPSLRFPRAVDNERGPMPPPLSRKESISSHITPVDDALPKRSRRPSLVVDTTIFSPSSQTPSSSGLSNVLKHGHARHDSGRSVPGRVRRTSERVHFQNLPDSSPRTREPDNESTRHRRQQDEDARQARLERGRLAESDLRQARRLEESRERHRREAAKALEGKRADERQRRHEIRQHRLNAEFAQMAREREEAVARRSNSVAERLLGGVEAAASPRDSRRSTHDFETYMTYDVSPASAKSSTHPVQLHHYSPADQGSNAMHERGEQVIIREQMRAEWEESSYPVSRARRASQRLEDVLNSAAAEEFQFDVVDEGGADQGRRKRQGARLTRRRQVFLE